MPENKFTRSFIKAGDVRLAYSEGQDNGPPLVLMHGITGNRHSYDCVIPYLEDKYRLLVVDHRGHGESSHHPGKYTMESMAGDIAGLLQEIVGQPAFVWGHSMGGRIALQLAVSHSELVRAIAVEDPPLGPGISRREDVIKVFQFWYDLTQEQLSENALFERLMKADDSLGEEVHRYKARTLHQMDPAILREALDIKLWSDVDALGIVDKVNCPAFMLQADEEMGGLIGENLSTIEAFQKTNWSWKRYDGVGHNLHATLPEESAMDVDSFLRNA